MKKVFKRIFGMSLATLMAISSLCFISAYAESDINLNASDEQITFVKLDENGNELEVIPLVKTEPGYFQANFYSKERAALAVWNLSNQSYYLTKSGYAIYRLPYQFTGTSGKSVYVNANMTVPNGRWAEIAINNVTNGTSYIGSVEMDANGNMFSISGKLNGILSNNYYAYTLQASSNCSYSEIELYQR